MHPNDTIRMASIDVMLRRYAGIVGVCSIVGVHPGGVLLDDIGRDVWEWEDRITPMTKRVPPEEGERTYIALEDKTKRCIAKELKWLLLLLLLLWNLLFLKE